MSVFTMNRFYAETHGVKLTKTQFRKAVRAGREHLTTIGGITSQREAFAFMNGSYWL